MLEASVAWLEQVTGHLELTVAIDKLSGWLKTATLGDSGGAPCACRRKEQIPRVSAPTRPSHCATAVAGLSTTEARGLSPEPSWPEKRMRRFTRLSWSSRGPQRVARVWSGLSLAEALEDRVLLTGARPSQVRPACDWCRPGPTRPVTKIAGAN